MSHASIRTISIALFFLVSTYTQVVAGEPGSSLSSSQSSEPVQSEGSIVGRLWGDISYMLSDRTFYGIVGGISLAPSAFHSDFNNESAELTELWGPSIFADNFFEAGEILGQGILPVSASAAIWSIGGIAGSNSAQSLGSDLLRAQAINGFATAALKGAINRKRPNGAPYSYPSGHTSSAFAVAGVIQGRYGARWGIPAFTLASYVGLSRLQEGKHFLSDIVAGGILGTYVGLTVARRGRRQGGLRIAPSQVGDAGGVSLSLRF